MLTTMLDLYNHHPSEDTTTTALLVLGVLKAAAVLKVVRQKTFNGYPLAFYSPLVGRLFLFKFVVIDTFNISSQHTLPLVLFSCCRQQEDKTLTLQIHVLKLEVLILSDIEADRYCCRTFA